MLFSRHTLFRYGTSMVGSGFGHGIALFAQIVFARLLGVEDYGLLTLAFSFILLPSNLADLGVTASTPRFIALSIGEGDHAKARRVVWTTGLFQGATSVVLTLALIFWAPLVARWMDMPKLDRLVLWLAVFVPGVFLFRWTTSVLKGLGYNMLQVFLDSFVLQLFTLVVGLGGWLVMRSTLGVTLGYGGAYLLTGIVGAVGVWRALLVFPNPRVKSDLPFMAIVKHGIPMNITALVQTIFRRTDIIIVGAMLDAGSVGVYRVASSIAGSLKRLLTPINDFAVYKMSRYVGMKKSEYALNHYKDIIIFSLTLALPMYIVLFLFGEEIVVLLYKIEYVEAAPLLRVLVIGFAAFIGVGPMGELFNSVGKNWIRMIFIMCMSVVNLVLNIVLIRAYGVIGCTYSTTLSFLAIFVVFQLYMKRQFFEMKIDAAPFAQLLLFGLLLAGGFAVSGGSWLVRIPVALAACGLSFGAGVLLLWRSRRARVQEGAGADSPGAP